VVRDIIKGLMGFILAGSLALSVAICSKNSNEEYKMMD